MARRDASIRAYGTGNSTTLPAPYGGLNLRENRALLQADQAREMENFFPDLGKLTVRPGFVSHANLVGEDFSQVVLLANFDGTDGATTSTDESDSAHTLNFSGDAQLDTAQKKFGTASLLLDGVSDYVSISNSDDFDFGSGQFTIECFIRLNSIGTGNGQYRIINSDVVGSRGWHLSYNYASSGATQSIDFAFSSNGTSFPASQQTGGDGGGLTANTWYHIAVDRDANSDLRVYIDGAMVGTTNAPGTLFDTTSDLFIGAFNPGTAAEFDGWIDAIRITKGLARYSGAFTAPTSTYPTGDIIGTVETLTEHKGVSARKMIAITTEGTSYDASSTSPVELSAAGYSDGRFQTDNFNNYLFGVNGTDTPWRYDGTSWLATGFSGSGLTITNLINVANVRNRLWFCENNTADVWYGGIGSVTGTLTKFQLSQIASGGRCQAIGSWSRDSGAGADDVTVFIMDTGQVIVYEGDPSTTFTLVGKYEAPEPIGRQCTVKIGGELIIITKSGFLPVSQIYAGLGDIAALDIWGQVASGVSDDYVRYGSLLGWHGVFHEGVAYFNVPLSASTAKQYVLNTRNNRWTTYAGWDAYAFATFGDDLYFSERAVGTIDKVSGTTDNGSAITCTARTGFSYPGGPSRNLQYTAMRPNISGKGTIQGRMGLDPDFNTRTLTGDLLDISSGSGGTPWGSPWGSSWGGVAEAPERWFGAQGIGRSVGVALEIETSASDVSWDSTDILARAGNVR